MLQLNYDILSFAHSNTFNDHILSFYSMSYTLNEHMFLHPIYEGALARVIHNIYMYLMNSEILTE